MKERCGRGRRADATLSSSEETAKYKFLSHGEARKMEKRFQDADLFAQIRNLDVFGNAIFAYFKRI